MIPDRRLIQAGQIVSLLLLAWMAYSFLNRVHWLLGAAVLLAAISNVAVAWTLRFAPARLTHLYVNDYLRRYVDWVCRSAGEQPPLEPMEAESGGELQLRSPEDFRVAAARAKLVVKGHDDIVDRLFGRIQGTIRLRGNQPYQRYRPPVAAVLLVGPEGVGKRYLARVIAKLLYRSGSVFTYDCGEVIPQWQAGGRGVPVELLEAVRRQPCHMLILERIDRAAPEFIQSLLSILKTGAAQAPDSGHSISFGQCLVVMSTTQGVIPLRTIAEHRLNDRIWHQRAAAAITSAAGIDGGLLSVLNDILLCEPLSDETMSEVAAMLMSKECKVHGVTLTTVDPLILAAEVLRIDEETGLSRLPQDIQKLLHKPLLAAAEQHCSRLSLHVRSPDNELTSASHE